ncbi:hypothetical protein IC582_028381 [Cucumis melo]
MPEFSSVTNQWDLLYDYNTLMENVSDPSYRFCSSPRLQGGGTGQNHYLSSWILMVPEDYLEQIRVTQGLVPSLLLLVTISTRSGEDKYQWKVWTDINKNKLK